MDNPLTQPCKQCEAAGITESPVVLDPYPYAKNALGSGWFFDPREGYEQDESKYL